MLKLEDFNFNKTEVDADKIRGFESEDDFMGLAVELFKEVAIVTSVLSCSYRLDENNQPRKWTRNEAVLGGLMVRLAKLQSSFLDQVCQRRMETAMIVLRCLGETLININYLIENNTAELFGKFIEYSLRSEKRLLNKINQNISSRGYELPIEKRMRKSIDRAFKTSSFKFEDVNEQNRQSWEENIYKKAESIGWEEVYFALFELPSHDVHGNWQNLITNHLEYEENEFIPSSGWTTPRPQPIFALGVLSAKTAKKYLDNLLPDCDDKGKVVNMLDDLILRVSISDELHEQFLQR